MDKPPEKRTTQTRAVDEEKWTEKMTQFFWGGQMELLRTTAEE